MRKTLKCGSFSGAHRLGLDHPRGNWAEPWASRLLPHSVKQEVPKAGWRLCPAIQVGDFHPRRAGQHSYQGSHTEQRNASPPPSPTLCIQWLTSASGNERRCLCGSGGGSHGCGSMWVCLCMEDRTILRHHPCLFCCCLRQGLLQACSFQSCPGWLAG